MSLTKRSPLGRRDPNVQQRSNDSVSSSIPSVEEALRLRRKKKKSKTQPLGSDGAFLIDSTSKTPRISNRSKQLPPRGGTTRQLRRLERSMASRTKQGMQFGNTNVAKGFDNNNNNLNHKDDDAAKKIVNESSGIKRKDHGEELFVLKKKLRGLDDANPTGDGSQRDHGVHDNVVNIEEVIAPGTRSYADVDTSMKLREAAVNERGDPKENDIFLNHCDQNVASDDLRKRRRSSMASKDKQQPLFGDEETASSRFETTNVPTGLESNVESTNGHVTDDAMMDCSSDDESLHLSPESARVASPSQGKVQEGGAWVLEPPPRRDRSTVPSNAQDNESEEEDDGLPRLSMTTHAERLSPRHTPTLFVDYADKVLGAAKDAHQDRARPIVTKGMLSRALQSKPDNEDVFEAMLNSGPAYTGRKEDSPASEASMIGTTIGINPLERCDSLDGSEVTMLTNDDDMSLNDPSPERHESKSDDANELQPPFHQNHGDRETLPESGDVSSRSSKSQEHRSSKNFQEPDEGMNEGGQVVYFEHDGVMIPHPPLPSGWIIRMSKSKQRPFYCHPDHGSTWHCPVVLPYDTTDAIFRTGHQRAFVNVPSTPHVDAKRDDDDDTESEDSEMWSGGRQRTNSNEDVKSVSSRQSQASVASTCSMTLSVDSMPETVTVEMTRDHGSETGVQDGLGQRLSPVEVEIEDEHCSPAQLMHGDHKSCASPVNHQSSKTEENGSETPSQTVLGSSDSFKSKPDDGVVRYGGTLSSPSPGVARVSLVTEANTEKLSHTMAEEVISTARFGRSNNGTVATRDGGTRSDDDDDFELVDANTSLGKTKESLGLIGVERDDTFLALLRESQRDGTSVDEATLRPADTEPATSESIQALQSHGDESKPADEDLAGDDTEDVVNVHDDSLVPPTGEEMKVDADVRDDTSEHLGLEDNEFPQQETLDSDELDVQFDSTEPVEHTLAHSKSREHNSSNDNEDVSLHGKHQDYESEVEDVVFSVAHDDIDLSPQAKHLSPIAHIDSFDNGGAPLVDKTESDIDEDDEPVGASPFPPNSASSADDADKVENGSVQEGEVMETANQDSLDDQVSVAGSFASTGADISTKWRGYSHRILYPPHPLCHLMSLEALIKAAKLRAERRKKARQSSKSKSSRRGRRTTTATKLVFE